MPTGTLLPPRQTPSLLPGLGPHIWSDLRTTPHTNYLRYRRPQAPMEQALIPEEFHSRRNATPIVVLFMGRRGQGKTLAMTALAWAMRRRYRQGRQRNKVMANYGITFADFCHPMLADVLANEYPDWARHSFVCIDEIVSAFPSRRSMAGVNQRFAQFLTQIRKFDTELAAATQFPQMLDRTMLYQVDLFIRCERIGYGEGVHLYVFDYWGQWTGKDFNKPWPPQVGEHDWELTFLNTHRMFGTYNSKEIIPPAFLANRDEILRRFWQFEEPEPDDEGAEAPPPMVAPPQTLEAYLESKLAEHPEGFNVMAYLTAAKRYEPSITNRKQFIAWLEAHGYTVGRTGSGSEVLARRA